jgi:hypothetical protein
MADKRDAPEAGRDESSGAPNLLQNGYIRSGPEQCLLRHAIPLSKECFGSSAHSVPSRTFSFSVTLA